MYNHLKSLFHVLLLHILFQNPEQKEEMILEALRILQPVLKMKVLRF